MAPPLKPGLLADVYQNAILAPWVASIIHPITSASELFSYFHPDKSLRPVDDDELRQVIVTTEVPIIPNWEASLRDAAKEVSRRL